MSYCVNCRHEYADSVEFCLECGRPLKRGNRPVRLPLDLSDFYLPAGALFCAVIALLMLYLRVGTQFGWVNGPIADLVRVGQPPCMTVFYAVALVASVLVFVFWIVNTLILRR